VKTIHNSQVGLLTCLCSKGCSKLQTNGLIKPYTAQNIIIPLTENALITYHEECVVVALLLELFSISEIDPIERKQ